MWWQYLIVALLVALAAWRVARALRSTLTGRDCGGAGAGCRCSGAAEKPEPFADRLGTRRELLQLGAPERSPPLREPDPPR